MFRNLYQLYKSSSEMEMEKLLLIPKKKKNQIQPRDPPTRGPRDAARAQRPMRCRSAQDGPWRGNPARTGAFAK